MANIVIVFAPQDGTDFAIQFDAAFRRQGWATWFDADAQHAGVLTPDIEDEINRSDVVLWINTPHTDDQSNIFLKQQIVIAQQLDLEMDKLVYVASMDAALPIKPFLRGYPVVERAADDQSVERMAQTLLASIERKLTSTVKPPTRRERQLSYLRAAMLQYEGFSKRASYTELSATTHTEVRSAAIKRPRLRSANMFANSNFHQYPEEGFSTGETEPNVHYSFASLANNLRERPRIALIGDPGCGKTTTLRHIGRQLAELAADDNAEELPLPLFVPLGGYKGGSLSPYLEEFFEKLPLEEYLANKRLVVLLDGLNEMGSAQAHEVAHWVDEHPEIGIIVTCRKLDYEERRLNLQRVDILPMDVHTILAFMEHYRPDSDGEVVPLSSEDRNEIFWRLAGQNTEFLYEAWQETGGTFDDFWQRAKQPSGIAAFERLTHDGQEAYRTLWQNWKSADLLPGLLQLARNPYLLTLTLKSAMSNGTLPRSQGDLFSSFVDQMIKERGKLAAHSTRTWIDSEVQRQALSDIAIWLQKSTQTFGSPEDIHKRLAERYPTLNAQHVIDFALSAGLFEQIGARLRFSHQLIQEFFSGYELARAIQDKRSASEYWPTDHWWTSTTWSESAVLLTGMAMSQGSRLGLKSGWDVVEWLRPVNPIVAWRCIIENDLPLSHPIAQSLMEPTGNRDLRVAPRARAAWGIQHASTDRRSGIGVRNKLPHFEWREVGGQALFRNWKTKNEALVEVSPFRISLYLITNAQFNAFIEDSGYEQEIWWEGLRRPEKIPATWSYLNYPRDRVSWREAVAFTRWASARLGQTITLPTAVQWQAALWGTEGMEFVAGSQFDPTFGNYMESGIESLCAVGMFPNGAAVSGALDMGGNLWELTQTEDQSPTVSSTTTNLNTRRAAFGNCWRGLGQYIRMWEEMPVDPKERSDKIGFRVIMIP